MGIEKVRRRISSAEDRLSTIRIGGISNSDDFFLMCAPCKCILDEVTFVSDTAMGTADVGTWSMQVYNHGTSQFLLGTSVVVNGPNSYTADTEKAIVVGTSNNILNEGEIIEFQIVSNATPTDISAAEIMISARYRPV